MNRLSKEFREVHLNRIILNSLVLFLVFVCGPLFAATPMTISVPAGGEVLAQGQSATAQVSLNGTVTSFNANLSRDGGVTFITTELLQSTAAPAYTQGKNNFNIYNLT
jgi:hypothetical protein